MPKYVKIHIKKVKKYKLLKVFENALIYRLEKYLSQTKKENKILKINIMKIKKKTTR